MGRCKQCGRWGLFLQRNEKSLCPKCQTTNRKIAEWAVGQMLGTSPTKTNVHFPNISESIKHREVLDIKSSDGCVIEKDYINAYDLDHLLEIDNFYYILNGQQNIERATNDILGLNQYIRQARQIDPAMPRATIAKESIKFEYKSAMEESERSYTTLSFYPKTKTGKLPLRRARVCFRANRNLFGNIDYSSDSIHAAEIMIWARKTVQSSECIRFGGTVWAVKLRKASGALAISTIQKGIDGNKRIIYKEP